MEVKDDEVSVVGEGAEVVGEHREVGLVEDAVIGLDRRPRRKVSAKGAGESVTLCA